MSISLRVFQDFASDFQKKETEDNLGSLLKTVRRCLDDYRLKLELAKEICNGVHERRSDGNDKQLTIQPAPALNSWVGETAGGSLFKDMERVKGMCKELERFMGRINIGEAQREDKQDGMDGSL